MRLAIKFGGTSVGDAERIRSAAGLVKRILGQGHQVVVVTSAMSGVTNRLVDLAQQATAPGGDAGSRVANYFRLTKQLELDHLDAARKAIRSPQLVDDVGRILYTERHGLDRVLLGSHLLGELTPIGSDFIVSEGERLCVPILANCLKDQGVDAVGLGGDEAGIVTDGNYGNALPLEERTREGVRQALLPLLEAGKVPVVAGFYGRSEQGRIAILGRGGSDFTATLVGCALDADEIWMLKHDVDGIKTTDPRLVPSAYTIPAVSYWIAAEMALLGAKVLHPKSVQPAARQRIPVRIASSFEPDKPGTRLVPLDQAAAPSVTALTLVRRAALVRASAREMGDEGIVPGSLIDAFLRYNIDVFASAVGFNGGRVLWLVGGQDLERFLGILGQHNPTGFEVAAQRNVAVLGLVGEQVATAPGVMARVARCLEQTGVHALTMLQGASPNSVVLALPDEEQRLSAVLKLLHTELGLDRRHGHPEDRP
jgi:aspartate kinase